MRCLSCNALLTTEEDQFEDEDGNRLQICFHCYYEEEIVDDLDQLRWMDITTDDDI